MIYHTNLSGNPLLSDCILTLALLLSEDGEYLPRLDKSDFWEAVFFGVGLVPKEESMKRLEHFLDESFVLVEVPGLSNSSSPAISLKEGLKVRVGVILGQYRNQTLVFKARILMNLDARGYIVKDAHFKKKDKSRPRREWVEA